MATTAGELLDEAQAVLWRSAVELSRDLGGEDRGIVAQQRYRELEAAWPGLANATRRMLELGSIGDVEETGVRRYGLLLEDLALIDGRLSESAAGGGVEHEGIARVAMLTSAATDALRIAGVDTATFDPAPIDQALTNLEQASRLAAVYLEQSGLPDQRPSAGEWAALAASARDEILTRPEERATRAARTPIARFDEPGLDGALQRWRTAAADAVTASSIPAADLPRVAVGMTVLYAHAAQRASGPEQHALAVAARAWRESATGWRQELRIPGPAHPSIRAATSELVAELRHAAAAGPPLGAQRALERIRDVATEHLPHLGVAYAGTLRQIVESGMVAVPARFALRDLDEAPAALLDEARRGRWVPLPSWSSSAQRLLEATDAAARTGADVLAAGEAGEALRRSAPAFPRSARYALDRTAATEAGYTTRSAQLSRGVDHSRSSGK